MKSCLVKANAHRISNLSFLILKKRVQVKKPLFDWVWGVFKVFAGSGGVFISVTFDSWERFDLFLERVACLILLLLLIENRGNKVYENSKIDGMGHFCDSERLLESDMRISSQNPVENIEICLISWKKNVCK